jgi:hypothetical protein
MTRGDDTQVITVAQTFVETTPAATTEVTTEAASTVSSSALDTSLTLEDVESLLVSYEDAYTNEDLVALENLFTADLRRDPGAGAGPPQDLSDALATYQEQFSGLADPVYELSNVTVSRSSDDAEAAGNYEITDGGRSVGSGSIYFHIVRLADTLYIDRLELTPSS